MADAKQGIEVLNGVTLQGDSLSDLTEAREQSQKMKQAMMTAPGQIVRDITRKKEEAVNLDKELDEADQRLRDAKDMKEELSHDIRSHKDDTQLRLRKIADKKLEVHKVQGDLKMYQEVLEKEANSKEPPLPYDNGGLYLRFLTGRGETIVRLQAAISRFENLIEIEPRVWSSGSDKDRKSLAYLKKEAEELVATFDAARKEVAILERVARRLKGTDFGHETDLTEYNELLSKAQSLHDNWTKRIDGEEERRVNYDNCVDEFMKELSRLVDWCKLQNNTLSQLPATEKVQEFCASLQGRIPMMEENFSVLTGMGEDLIPGPQQRLVEKMLVDVSRVWIDLQIYSYERMRDAFLEEHARCGLKEEAQAFASWASQNVKSFLDRVEELLRTPDEQESQSIVRPVLEMCKSLQSDYAPHQLIIEHISDFDVRMEVINDHYRHLKKTITSPLTFICQKLNAFDSGYHRKDEYDQRVRDLHDWIDIRDSNAGSWKIVHSKLSEVHQTIEMELRHDSKAA